MATKKRYCIACGEPANKTCKHCGDPLSAPKLVLTLVLDGEACEAWDVPFLDGRPHNLDRPKLRAALDAVETYAAIHNVRQDK